MSIPAFSFYFCCALTLFLLLMHLPSLINSQVTSIPSNPAPSGIPFNSCDSSQFQTNSVYGQNLNGVMKDLGVDPPSPSNLFKQKEKGSGSDRVYGYSLCLFSSLSAAACSRCIDNAVNQTSVLCPNANSATIVYDECLVGYSNQTLSSGAQIIGLVNTQNISSFDTSTETSLHEVLNALQNDVPSSSKPVAVESGENSTNWVYGFAECHNLSSTNCTSRLSYRTLEQASSALGARIIFNDFFFRYEITNFYTGGIPFQKLNSLTSNGSIPTPSPSKALTTSESAPTPSSYNHASSKGDVVVIVVTSLVGGLLIGVCILLVLCFRLKYRKGGHLSIETKFYKGCQMFTFETLKQATNNFSPLNKLGKGGFGTVYKGILYNGIEVAIKHLSSNSHQGDDEFINEVVIITSIQHKNLVKLEGCCIEGEERLLVYEYLDHKSLDSFLFGTRILNWKTRYNIILGIARGLTYLHEECEPRIIHRDIKVSNILLDINFQPKIADFGLARLFPEGESFISTTTLAGTKGYLAPELLHGHLSVKSDVFSFGILLFEIISGRSNNDRSFIDDNFYIIDWAFKICKQGLPLEIIDQKLEGFYSENQALGLIDIATLCVQIESSSRPKMSHVIQMILEYSE